MTEQKSHSRVSTGPLFVTFGMLLWAVTLSPHTEYGDNWAVYPLLIAYFFAVAWHVFLIIRDGKTGRLQHVLYAVIHIVIATGVLMWSLMKISKDAL